MSLEKLIDFTELISAVPGEGLEELVRQIGRRKKLSPAWSGRGADGGRDLYFTEILSGSLREETIKWLVSCKDKAKSKESVSESDLPSPGILDKLAQHKANGFLLVTTTTVSTAAKDLLDKLDKSNGGNVYTLVWDSSELTAMLLDPNNQDLLKQFLPQSYRRVKGLTTLEGAVLAFRDQLPENVLSEVMRLVRPYSIAPLKTPVAASGSVVDQIVSSLLIDKDVTKAISLTVGIGYSSFIGLAEKLYDKYPEDCYDYLSKLVCEHEDANMRFNAVQFLFDNFEISPSEYIRFAAHLDERGLKELYSSEIVSFVESEMLRDPTRYEIFDDLSMLSKETSIKWVSVTDLAVRAVGDDRIEFNGTFDIDVELQYGDEEDDSHPDSYPGKFQGFFDVNGMYIESTSADTSDFYGVA